MKKLILFYFITAMLCLFNSCQEEVYDNSNDIIYDLENGKFKKDLSGSFSFSDKKVSVKSFRIEAPDSNNGFYYLYMSGEIEYPDITKSIIYALPLIISSNNAPDKGLTLPPNDEGGGGCVKHKCESYDDLVFGCSECQFFKRNGKIVGCKCAQFLGACLHSVEECGSSRKYGYRKNKFNENEVEALTKYIKNKL